jgi:hypothetical protein
MDCSGIPRSSISTGAVIRVSTYRRHARRLDDDLDLRRGHIGERIDRKLEKRPIPRCGGQHGQQDHEHPLTQRKAD